MGSHKMVTIREMIPSDAAAVSEIVSDGYADLARQERFSPDQADRLQGECATVSVIAGWLDQWTCCVALSDDGIVGAVATDQNDVAEIWVRSKHRGTGIGTTLFGRAEHVIAEAGFSELTARCAAAGARPFYEAMGCVAVAVKPCPTGPLTGWPLTHYRKDLKANKGMKADHQ